jgi:hypothetical protein
VAAEDTHHSKHLGNALGTAFLVLVFQFSYFLRSSLLVLLHIFISYSFISLHISHSIDFQSAIFFLLASFVFSPSPFSY